ncbi:hypothetical protein [Allocoleopsis franciscana]|uniref:HetZ-related protein n=1 Tax=Allocoleopsis franciscana PCC 7113 TaxID=1173027 RepID=K9WDN5_9CYAN|nr:hypothetical protein [Allocoleopsis franciscana]AFZ18505.1 hypothetical protein Mic7113_2720 [Allocoleopsis franciscana PCC 7113]
MNTTTSNSLPQSSVTTDNAPDNITNQDTMALIELLKEELTRQLGSLPSNAVTVIQRIVTEVERICDKSDRIQQGGDIRSWQLTLARHRLSKCVEYYKLGSKQGRVELHSNLSVMIYRQVAPAQAQLSFAARRLLIEDFLQDFYADSLKAFRRENQVADNYTPRTKIELAEYMAFTEQYAKRRVMTGYGAVQLLVLRAKSFAKRQPTDTVMDIEQVTEFAKGEEAQMQSRSPMIQQVRERLVAETKDPHDAVLRDRVVGELVQYLESQGHKDCADYLILKLQDFAAPEIDNIMGLTPRQRDYLQQRFKYHVEKFARTSQWQLVHQWLGADLDQKLGLSSKQWDAFVGQLDPMQQQLLELKRAKMSDFEIVKALKITPKQVQKRWTQVLEMASLVRNNGVETVQEGNNQSVAA